MLELYFSWTVSAQWSFLCRCLEQLLNECLKAVPRLSLPQLHFLADESVGDKQEKKQSIASKDPPKPGPKRKTKMTKKQKESATGNAGEGHTQDSQRSQRGQPPANTTEGVPVAGASTDVSKESGIGTCTVVEEQRWKFRALTLTCSAILSLPEVCLGLLVQLQSVRFLTKNLCYWAVGTLDMWC